jgi:hypothetical protein
MKRLWPFPFLILLFFAFSLRTDPPFPAPVQPLPSMLPHPEARTSPVAAAQTTPSPAEEPEEQPPPPRTGLVAAFRWLTRVQNQEGSWGDGPVTLGGRTIGRTGVTSLALLTLMGAGYSQLSRDEFDPDKPVGPMIQRALDWMLQQQGQDGSFPSGFDSGFEQALATFALSEAYGMTARQPLKEPVTKALAALVTMQGSDGSWGGAEPTVWAGLALFSGELSDLPIPADARDRMLAYMKATTHPGNVLNRILHLKDKTAVSADALAIAASPPEGDGRDFLDWNTAGVCIFQYDGPDGPLWKGFNERMRDTVASSQQRDGSWIGGSLSHMIARTSLAAQTLEVYYRYVNVFSTSK